MMNDKLLGKIQSRGDLISFYEKKAAALYRAYGFMDTFFLNADVVRFFANICSCRLPRALLIIWRLSEVFGTDLRS